MSALLLAHLAATMAMAGVIWFVQVVHYPLFAAVGAAEFQAYERSHVTRTSMVLLPLMLAEATTAVLLLIRGVPLSGVGAALLALCWTVTFLVSVPCHRKLENGFDPQAHARLVNSNWMRTLAWSARAVTASLMLLPALRAATY